MVEKVLSGPKDRTSTCTRPKGQNQLTFDFVVAERPKYTPKSGTSLAPISVMPAHDKDGIILNKFQLSGQSQYLIGYEDQPLLRIAVKPQNILNWVSARTFIKFDNDQSQIKERLREENQSPKIIAQEERRRRFKEKKDKIELESRGGVIGRKRKRSLNPEMPRKLGRPRIYKASLSPTARPSGPDRRNVPSKEEIDFVSPRSRHSQHSQQPSLTTPVRGLAQRLIPDSESEEDESFGNELALERQLNGLNPRSHWLHEHSNDTSTQPGLSKPILSRLGSVSKPSYSQTDEKVFQPASPFQIAKPSPGRQKSQVHVPNVNLMNFAASKNRGAQAAQEDTETDSKQAVNSVNWSQPRFIEKPSPFKSVKKAVTLVNSSQADPALRQPGDHVDEHEEEEDEEDEDDVDGESEDDEAEFEADEEDDGEGYDGDQEFYEVKAIVDDKIEVIGGKRRLFYLIHWKGSWDDTWEPEKNVGAEAVARYRRKQRRLGLDGANSSESAVPPGPKHNDENRNSAFPRLVKSNSVVAMAENHGVDGGMGDEDSLFVSERPQNSSEVLGGLHKAVDEADDTDDLQWQVPGVLA